MWPTISVFLTAFTVATLAVGWLARSRLAQLAIDQPNARSLHATPVPRTGGVVLARAPSKEALVEIMQRDPFCRNGVATFEIITLTGWAPHEAQQKPLQPGSAKMRLADALGVVEVPLPRDDDEPTSPPR